jgi:hypothetical protein
MARQKETISESIPLKTLRGRKALEKIIEEELLAHP